MGKRRKRKASLVGQRLEDSTAANGLTAVSWFRKNTGALGGLLVVGIMAGMACVRIASDVCIRYTPLTRGSKEWATGVLQTYPVGAVTRVYYDPGNPGESVLNRSYTAKDWLLLAFLMPFVAVGAALIVLTVRAARDCRMGSTNVSPRIAD